jgi:hypothetical protein
MLTAALPMLHTADTDGSARIQRSAGAGAGAGATRAFCRAPPTSTGACVLAMSATENGAFGMVAKLRLRLISINSSTSVSENRSSHVTCRNQNLSRS